METTVADPRRDPAAGVHGTIVLAIGEDIVRGEVKPGQRLPREAELIERFQASRTAIREAMKVLTAKGLVQARQRVGTKVRPRAKWDLLDPNVLSWHDLDTIGDTLVGDLVELRQFLEPKAARLAAERATEDDIEAMQAAHHRMDRAASDPAEFYTADIAFHLAVFAGCHNLLIQRLSGIVETVLTLSFRLQDSELVDLREAANAHGRVIDRIRLRDRAGAERAMRAVIGRAKVELRRRRTRIAVESCDAP
jgi:GntR family galactonate operon transcriptional repressor